MFKVNETAAKVNPAKRTLDLKNISVRDLRLVDTDTGEDITNDVVAALPKDAEVVNFKITFELPEVAE